MGHTIQPKNPLKQVYFLNSRYFVSHHGSTELPYIGHTSGTEYRRGSVAALHSQHVVNAEDQKHQAEIFEQC